MFFSEHHQNGDGLDYLKDVWCLCVCVVVLCSLSNTAVLSRRGIGPVVMWFAIVIIKRN